LHSSPAPATMSSKNSVGSSPAYAGSPPHRATRSQKRSTAHDSMCVSECRMACREARVPPLPLRGARPGGTSFTTSSEREGREGADGQGPDRGTTSVTRRESQSSQAASLNSAFFHGQGTVRTLTAISTSESPLQGGRGAGGGACGWAGAGASERGRWPPAGWGCACRAGDSPGGQLPPRTSRRLLSPRLCRGCPGPVKGLRAAAESRGGASWRQGGEGVHARVAVVDSMVSCGAAPLTRHTKPWTELRASSPWLCETRPPESSSSPRQSET